MTQPDDWRWSSTYHETCLVLARTSLWGASYARVWLPRAGVVTLVPGDSLRPVTEVPPDSDRFLAAILAGRVIEAMGRETLLAAADTSVTPLPHQINALARAMSGARVRFLLADEVGLGKTVEAGLILRELKLRRRVCRALVVAPKGLVAQWIAEMKTHFHEDFRLILPAEAAAVLRLGGDNPWARHDQVVCPIDAVKPIDARRGWSREQVDAYNRNRLGALVAANWDLIIVDEAHRLAGSTDQVARYRLGEALARAAPSLLLLSATPHQGRTDGFQRLLALLDADAFRSVSSVTRERVAPYVIRTEKRRAVDAQGAALFRPRRTQLVSVAWEAGHELQHALYEAVTEYVREGYGRALRERRPHLGFLMVLMQRLVTSSTAAIAAALRRRLDVLGGAVALPDTPTPESVEGDWHELDGQEQLDVLPSLELLASGGEREQVRGLLALADRAMAGGPDAKAEALLAWVRSIQREEDDASLKVLVFTEFVPTQAMLRDHLAARGFSVVCLNGSMDLDARRRVQAAFAADARVLISTDAGGEGLNLQFCHVVVNYDLPWNPMRIEQRIGRVDRIGQAHDVRALNFVLHDTVEHRVQDVLEEKLQTILDEFGVDKTGDVLDSVEAARDFDDAFVTALLDPSQVEARVDALLALVRDRAAGTQTARAVLPGTEAFDVSAAQDYVGHPLPGWIERMAVASVRSDGGRAERVEHGWMLTWPGQTHPERVTFRNDGIEPGATTLTLDDSRVRALLASPPRALPGELVPVLALPEIPASVRGAWSLWRVSYRRGDERPARAFAVFVHDDGRVLLPTARMLWDRLVGLASLAFGAPLDAQRSEVVLAASREAAERVGAGVWTELLAQGGGPVGAHVPELDLLAIVRVEA